MLCQTYMQISDAIIDAIEARATAAGARTRRSWSNLSCSAYLYIGDFKIRVSDHRTVSGEPAGFSILFKSRIDEVEDECGDVELEIADWWIEEQADAAIAASFH